MDALPVMFGDLVQSNEPGSAGNPDSETSPLAALSAALRDLTEIIWKEGGFRFKHKGSNLQSLTYTYRCSQDLAHVQGYHSNVDLERRRDGRRMMRFDCKSKLVMRACFQSRTLSIIIHHEWHPPYEDVQVPPMVRELINELVATKTPSEIYREIRGMREAETVTRYQVYYLWQRANAEIWQRDADPVASAEKLLSEYGQYQGRYGIIQEGNVRALCLYAPENIMQLSRSTTQLVMDSTYGTNNTGMDLFAALAEIDGTGVPLAYCLTEVVSPSGANARGKKKKARADPGATSVVLYRFLKRLKDGFGFNPACFAIDKDTAEIAAVTSVWKNAKIQLCYWHIKRAVSLKLNSSKETDSQDNYWPAEAQKVIPELEICWGSKIQRRPSSHLYPAECECPSRTEKFEDEGRLEPRTKDEKQAILDMMCRHFHFHPFIPDQNGTFKSSDLIHRECATEMYRWCRARGYFRLWAYLFVNWYHPEQWELWARSADPKQIPTVKTTMIAESHWRTLKHDYLHRFNRPRVDLIVFILITRVLPDAEHRLSAILSGQTRVHKARWREAFKRQWKRDAAKSVDPQKMIIYHTNPVNWVCGCRAFLQNRFLTCKHIVHCYEFPDPQFFQTVKRRTTRPFWKGEGLILRPEYAPAAAIQGQEPQEDQLQESDLESGSELDSGNEAESELYLHDDDQDDEGSWETRVEEGRKMLADMLELYEDQVAKRNVKWVDLFLAAHQQDRLLVEEANSLRRKRTMPRNSEYRHRLTRYLR